MEICYAWTIDAAGSKGCPKGGLELAAMNLRPLLSNRQAQSNLVQVSSWLRNY